MREPAPQPQLSINRILFATDFSRTAKAAFSYAAAVADRYHAMLYVAHVINVESFDMLDSETARGAIQQAHAEAERKLTELLEPPGLPRDRYQIVVAEGVIAETLIDIIQKNHIDLAVLGTHGRRALRKVFLGSVAEEVFRTSPCPVLTVGPNTAPFTGNGEVRHILYPVEYAPDLTKAAQYAVSLAQQYPAATLTVMNVIEQPSSDTPSTTDMFLEPPEYWIRDHLPPGSDLQKRIRFTTGYGPAAQALLSYVATSGVDLIVMSVRELDPVMAAHLPRSDTAHALVSRAPCPVLTIRWRVA